VGEWVIQTALLQLSEWHRAGLRIPVSVNVGARQLQDDAFVSRLSGFLADHPEIAPGDLELELLETSALEDVIHVSKVITACQAIGVAFALDDFGTGYSSLTYLKRLPVRQLKIDQSFVRDMLDDPDDLAILEGVIGLASAFGRHVIAEGVETTEHGHMLLQLGCECAQGYGVARPMPGQDFLQWAAAWRPHPAWHNVPVLDKDHRPVLSACVEHRAWMQAMRTHLTGERDRPPELHPAQCHFGSWLATPGAWKLGSPILRQRIEEQHQQLHQTAAALCQRHSEGDWAGAKAGLASLEVTSDELMALLMTLLAPATQAGVSPELEP
jgi:EAL domain-containing protein (putative c-di-GMP-specific phosphodiesterase class I)